MGYPGFRERLGACVMGATTWQWILDHDDDPWGPLPTWVLTHRTFPRRRRACGSTATTSSASTPR